MEKETLSALARQEVEAKCIEEELRANRKHALENLLSLDAPVSDWEKMEDEITIGCEHPHVCRRQRPSLQGSIRLDHDLGGVAAGHAYYLPRVAEGRIAVATDY